MPQTTMIKDMKTKISALKWADIHLGQVITELEHIATDDQDAVEIMHMIHEIKRTHSKVLYMRAKLQNVEASQTNLQEVNRAEEKLQEGAGKTAEETEAEAEEG